MIKTGVDAVEISRFSNMENIDSFLERVFTKDERKYFSQKKVPYESIAGHYAAKEAFSKYIGSGIRGFSLKDIEVCHNEYGKPYIKFIGKNIIADLSITHTQNMAIAVVCGEGKFDVKRVEYSKTYGELLPMRGDNFHKGDCGRVFIIAGSCSMSGAACLCADAALRCGSGLVTVGTPKSQQPIIASKLTEAMVLPFEEKDGVLSPEAFEKILKQADSCDVVAIGPGLGKVEKLSGLIEELIKKSKKILIDADGINGLAGNIDILSQNCSDIVLTPHLGEMSRLCGLPIDEIQKNRQEIVQNFARKYKVTLLLKGKNTVVASSEGVVHINPSGNSGMASGGMGDVLSGVVASFMGQGLSGFDGAKLGAFIHGFAGDIGAEEKGKFGLIARDVIEKLPVAIMTIE